MTANLITIVLISTLCGTVLCRHDPPKCGSQAGELWPHNDVNKYWFCVSEGALPIEMPCGPGTGFIRSADQHGCAPYELWGCATDAVKPNCNNPEHYDRPQRHINPNKFWACSEDRIPVELNCEVGRGFTDNGMKDPSLNFGCVHWPEWSNPICKGSTIL